MGFKKLDKPGRKLNFGASLKIYPVLLGFSFLLGACNDTPPSPTSPPANSPAGVVTNLASPPTVPLVTSTTNPASPPTPTALPPITANSTVAASPLPSVSKESNVQNQILGVIKSFSEVKSYSFKLSQIVELKSGEAVTNLEGSGTGTYQAPNFYQKLVLNNGGQDQELEYFVNGPSGFQRVKSLALWRKIGPTPPVWTAFPPTLPTGAAGFQNQAQGTGQTQLRYTFPASQLITSKEAAGPEFLGVLSATNILKPFLGQIDPASQVEVKLLVNDSSGALLRREVSFSFSSGENRLKYSSAYDYSDLNSAAITLTPPPDLPG